MKQCDEYINLVVGGCNDSNEDRSISGDLLEVSKLTMDVVSLSFVSTVLLNI